MLQDQQLALDILSVCSYRIKVLGVVQLIEFRIHFNPILSRTRILTLASAHV